MNFSIANFIKALNIVQQIKEEVEKSGFDLGNWVDVFFKLFPAIINFLEMFNTPTPAPTASFGEVKATVEAAGFDFSKWIALLMKIAPLIQQLIDIFTTSDA
jgi:hypothetical protein